MPAALTTAEYEALVARETPEAAFQAQVIEAAASLGWGLIYHTHDSRRSQKGFPDLVMVRGTRLLFVELKRVGEKPRVEQVAWLEGLEQVAAALRDLVRLLAVDPRAEWMRQPSVEVYVWHPDQWAEIREVLA
jgi:hypothetical protein